MRIFCAVRHSNDPDFYYGGLWNGNFYPALRHLGHEIVESQVDLLPTSRFMHAPAGFTPRELEVRARITAEILDEVRAAHHRTAIDLFLSYFYNAHFDPAGFDEIRKLGIPSVNFYCNSIYQFENVAAIAAGVDYSWHAERDAHDRYVKAGARPVWVQMGADPEVYHPVPGVSRRSRACFIGQRYADRERWLAALKHAGVPFEIYGSGWRSMEPKSGNKLATACESHLGRKEFRPGTLGSYLSAGRENFVREGFIGGLRRTASQWQYRRQTQEIGRLLASHAKGKADDIATTLARYEICLNFSNVWADGRPGSELVSHVRLRDFEAPMCRTCYLTGYTDEITEFYKIGKEIDIYRSAQELVDKTRFYLANPDAAERLRDAGYERARRDHTWVRRFEELFEKIGLTRKTNRAVAST